MEQSLTMRRRSFLCALALGPLCVASCQSHKADAPGSRPSKQDPSGAREGALPVEECQVAHRDGQSPRVLTAAQWDALDAACERILPKDKDPGAREVGVVNYIDAQLLYPPVSAFRALLQAGAGELDRLAGARGRPRFSALAADEQDRILADLPHQRMGEYSGARFFQVLVALTMEGFFGDPIYGGNRDQAGWKMIKLVPRSPGALCVYRGRR